MGQKVNPTGLRLGINRTWDSRWYAGKKEYGKLLQEDIKIREYLSDKLKAAGVSRIVIERPHKKCRVTIHSARPGVVIGKKGADIEKLKSDVQKFTADEVHLNIVEIRKPEIDAKLVDQVRVAQIPVEQVEQRLERLDRPHRVGALPVGQHPLRVRRGQVPEAGEPEGHPARGRRADRALHRWGAVAEIVRRHHVRITSIRPQPRHHRVVRPDRLPVEAVGVAACVRRNHLPPARSPVQHHPRPDRRPR